MNEKTNTQAEIKITSKAISQVKKIMQENQIPNSYSLRVSVKGGGCSGFTYNLGFDEEIQEGDTIIEQEDLKILIDGKSLFYLMGCGLDFSDGLNGKGFVFSNPNAKKTCGCVESFNV
ncbi:MAG: heme biosynthesis protein HemY [Ignavibacteria bacterium RBG_13_36_8]|nr:MAG: heme biosynthesis protein HemY [Ignavibacteria bacterium RBG_13_36_8]